MRTKIQRALSLVLFTAALFAASFAAPESQAQTYNVSSVPFVSATTLTNSVTWAHGGTVSVDSQTMCGLVVKFQGASASSSNIVTTLARSGDGVNFETIPPSTLSFTNALNGTNVVISYWQIPRDVLGSAQSLKLLSVQNFSSSVNATNATISIIKKREPVIY